MEKANKFYTIDASRFTDDQVKNLKYNNIFIINTLAYLINLDGNSAKLDTEYRDAIMKRQLPTIGNLNNCHSKLRFLIIALQKKENRDIFLKSGIVNYVMNPLLRGYTKKGDEVENWDNYINRQDSSDQDLANKSPYRAGLFCYRESDRNFPIGLDFTKIIDTIVKVDSNGRYYLSADVDEATKAELLDATQIQIDKFKGSKRFKDSFYNYAPEMCADDEENENN